MKSIKKKMFTRGTFLFLALMLMLTPFAFSVAADDAAISVIDDCCAITVMIDGEPIMVTMSTKEKCSAGYKGPDGQGWENPKYCSRGFMCAGGQYH
jgi:hypothetical protein